MVRQRMKCFLLNNETSFYIIYVTKPENVTLSQNHRYEYLRSQRVLFHVSINSIRRESRNTYCDVFGTSGKGRAILHPFIF